MTEVKEDEAIAEPATLMSDPSVKGGPTPLNYRSGAVPGSSARVVLALCATVLIWGSAFGYIRIALHAYGAGEMALLRCVFASLALGLYAAVIRMPLPKARDLPGLFLLGFLGFSFYYAALNFGERTVPSGVASLLIATAPIFTALFAVVLLRERLGLRGWVGVLIAFTGVVLIIAGQQGNFGVSRDALLILVAAISAAVYFVMQRRFLNRYSSLQLTTYAIWTGTVLLLVFAPGLPGQMRAAPTKFTLAVAYLGVFPAALGYVFWNYALSQRPVSRVSSYLYLVPVVAMTGGWIWLAEVPTRTSLCGGPVAVAGVYLVNTRSRKSRV